MNFFTPTLVSGPVGPFGSPIPGRFGEHTEAQRQTIPTTLITAYFSKNMPSNVKENSMSEVPASKQEKCWYTLQQQQEQK